MRWALLLVCGSAWAHDAHGRSNAPMEARRLKSLVAITAERVAAARGDYETLCASCHGADGKARTTAAGKMTPRPTDFTNYLMESMKDGEIYWVVKHGIDKRMPAFGSRVSEERVWDLVGVVRELRQQQRDKDRAQLGPYSWRLPPGFPYPNVPAENLMTEAKVELGRHLFYDRRLSLNQTQSCASCHKQQLAFTDGKPRGVGSTGEKHPRGPMGLFNVAYNPVLTWANPLVKQLEQQALVPLFGDHPVELGMAGKEGLLEQRLKAVPKYRKLFGAAFGGEITMANAVKAIASFERTLLSGDSPYDEYRRGDDVNAISAAAKRGEELFFSEKLECFHCHGGFNFTGTVDYLGKGFVEVEFHNTGLYNLPGKFSYPEPNVGLYEFTQQPDDVGKFKAPSLRNIAVTAPYMHDGSVKTLEDAIAHYASGGKDNPNKSEFVKPIDLSAKERADVKAFLESLTDREALVNPKWSNPWMATPVPSVRKPKYVLRGEVVRVFAADQAVTLYHEEVPGFMKAMEEPYAMEFLVPDARFLQSLKPGMKVTAGVRKRGGDYVLEPLAAVQPKRSTKQ